MNLSVFFGQSWEVALANFETGIARAQAQHATWIRRVEWAPDRTSARRFGPGYEVLVSVNHESVSATGTIPIAPWLLQRPLERFLEATFQKRKS